MTCDSVGEGDDSIKNFRVSRFQIENKAFVQSEMNYNREGRYWTKENRIKRISGHWREIV
jgi:hypothetical protein